jgi:hypothetical protein
MRRVRRIAWKTQAGWMRLVSFFKEEWTINDHPIRVRFQRPTERMDTARRKLIPWIADVVNWPAMSGKGSTRQEALDDMRGQFERFIATRQPLPRPGIVVPLEFAASDRVGRHQELTKDFAQRVLDLEWVWISDASSLWDFHGDDTNERLIEKIRSVYGIDVSDIASRSLADIFDRISKREAVPPTPD